MKYNPEACELSPDFLLPNRDVVTEATWVEFAAQGFRHVVNVPEELIPSFLTNLEATCGGRYLFTGDGFSREAGQPLHNIPAKGIYIHPESPQLKETGYFYGTEQFTTPLSGPR